METKNAEKIAFNVGKRSVAISKEALARCPNSIFAMLVKNTDFKSVKDELGAICVDHECPVIHDIVLFMEKGILPDTTLFQGLMVEDARYFGLLDLVAKLEQRLAISNATPSAQPQQVWPRLDGVYVVYTTLKRSHWAFKIIFQCDNKVTLYRAGNSRCKGKILG